MTPQFNRLMAVMKTILLYDANMLNEVPAAVSLMRQAVVCVPARCGLAWSSALKSAIYLAWFCSTIKLVFKLFEFHCKMQLWPL